MLLSTFFTLPYVFEKTEILTLAGMIHAMFAILLYVFGMLLLAIIIVYITELNTLLSNYTMQSEKLLDGMHEGLLIFSKSSNDTLFCNMRATSLLKGAMNFFNTQLTSQTPSSQEDR